MVFLETTIPGAYILEPKCLYDERGFFARIWCKEELRQFGLNNEIVQSNVGFSYRKGTLRGLHFQQSPYAEAKLVRCTQGAVFDVIVDLRPQSRTYCQWYGIELTEDNRRMIYAPEGCAQGYMTLADNTEIYYHTSACYSPKAAAGVRFDDPLFNIQWPLTVAAISEQDRHWPLMVKKEP